MISLTRYWIEFERTENGEYLFEIPMGFGVTAYNSQDAVKILKEKVFIDCNVPPIKNITENVNVSKLDNNHILPNMAPPNWRGIWFPLGYE